MRTDETDILACYTSPAAMTSAGRYAPLLAGLPRDVAGLAAVLHGLLIHEHMAEGYGVTLTEADRASVHIRPVAGLLARIMARDSRPLVRERPPADRIPGNCRHFTVLMVAMLRAQGTPARARCGFGGYFTSGFFEDHWVCEYWHREQRRWLLADPQIDERQRGWFQIGFDLTDVPREEFLVAGQAWQLVRSGAADPGKFGLSLAKEAGEWWIAANLIRDAAALLNVEVLPWDCWGAMPGPEDVISAELAALLGRLAVLTQQAGTGVRELRELCESDPRLRVPPIVRNAVRGQAERLYGRTDAR